MAGTCNSVRCLPTSALSRAEVTGDFRGSLMRRSSKVRSTRRCDCGDYQAAARTTCSAAELNRRPRYKRAMLALWLMTAFGQTRRFDDVRVTSAFPPDSRRSAEGSAGPKCATTGLMQCNNGAATSLHFPVAVILVMKISAAPRRFDRGDADF